MPDNIRDERDDGEFRRGLHDGARPGPLHHGPPDDRVEDASEANRTSEPASDRNPDRATSRPQGMDNRPATDDEKHRRAERRYWAVTGGASLIAAGAAVVAAAYAGSAYRAAMDTVSETRAQAQAAREANAISGRALAAAVGSSVYFGEGGIRMFTNPQQVIKVNIIAPIGNGGGTTTRGLTYTGDCADTADPSTNPVDFKHLSVMQAHHITLAPKQTVNIVVCSYALDRWRLMAARGESVFLYGQASYRDTVNPGAFATGEECPHHNCADDECEAG